MRVDGWAEALALQDSPVSLVSYLLRELAVPAERIRQTNRV